MDNGITAQVAQESSAWYIKVIDFFKNIILVVFYIFYYAFVGIKACTYDLFVYIYNFISWRLDKAYKKTKEVLKNDDVDSDTKKKKEKTYVYSARRLAKLEKEREELIRDLQSNEAIRTKETNVYYFEVRDKNGKIIKGTMNGLSKLDINSFLINEGYTVYNIKTSPMINFLYKESSFGSPKMSVKELQFLLTQLATYLKAGITLNDAIKILSRQMARKKSKARAFQSISYELTLGSSFSVALEKQGNMFPALLINMVKAAEASGTLIETLEDMANYYTEVDETKKQMKSAMMYPIIVSIFAVGVITFILLYIIPKFVEIYEQNDVELRGITAFVIKSSLFLQHNILLISGIIFLFVIIFIMTYKNLKVFRRTVQKFFMHIPVIKDVIIYNELAIFTKTFASLLRNNVFITESIDILSRITNNEIYKSILYRTINNIIKGEKISEAFKDHWAIPDVAYFMIVTGESTGELANMMQKVSDYYQGLHRNVVNNLKSFIEPIMIAFLAIVVGGIIIAVVIPMFGMYDQIM